MRMSRKSPKVPSRKMDMTAMREALADRRCWACLGLVVKGDDGNHFELTPDDVLVEVELVPSERRITARLGALAGGSDKGVWAVPAVDTEVAVLVPDGEFECGPVIVATLSTGSVPSQLDETNLVVRNGGTIVLHTDGDVVADAAMVKLGSASAVESTLLATSWQSAYTTFLTALDTFLQTVLPTGAPPAAVTTMRAAVTTLSGQLATFLTQKVKVE